MRMTYIPATAEEPAAWCYRDRQERLVEPAVDFMTFLADSSQGLSDRTLTLYAGYVNLLCAFLEDHDVFGRETVSRALVELSGQALNTLFRRLQTAGASIATVHNVEAGIRRICSWANSEASGYLHKRPLYIAGEKGYTSAPSDRIPRALSFKDICELCLNCHLEAQRLAIHFLYDTGLRISELPRVRRRDLPDVQNHPENWNYFLLNVRGSKGRMRKEKAGRTIISRPLMARIGRHHNSATYPRNYRGSPDSPAIVNAFGEPWTVDALESMIRVAKRRAGLEEAHAHMLRHGFANSILRSEHGQTGIDKLVIASQALRHSHLSTTEVYTQVPVHLLDQMLNALGTGEFANRFEQSQELFDKTFLPAKKQRPVRRIQEVSL